MMKDWPRTQRALTWKDYWFHSISAYPYLQGTSLFSELMLPGFIGPLCPRHRTVDSQPGNAAHKELLSTLIMYSFLLRRQTTVFDRCFFLSHVLETTFKMFSALFIPQNTMAFSGTNVLVCRIFSKVTWYNSALISLSMAFL